MALTGQIETVSLLNIDTESSTISNEELIINSESSVDCESFIVSDVDEELLILIKFKNEMDLKSIKIYSLKQTINYINETEIINASQPNEISIYIKLIIQM